MTNILPNTSAIQKQLHASGLSELGLLHSTGVAQHLRRLKAGDVDAALLARYASDLRVLADLTSAENVTFPVDFWDVRTPAMQAVGLDEYALVNALAANPYRPYVSFLARCFGHLTAFKRDGQTTAVATTLRLLRESAAYIQGEHPCVMTRMCQSRAAEPRAIFLWQQVTAGTNRQIPYLHRDAYTHAYWSRFNVVEMWRYQVGQEVGVDQVWGLSGFHPNYIRDPANTNQIEHLTISALSQGVLRLPVFFLNRLEDVQHIMHESSREAAQADKSVNDAIARHFLPLFTLNDVNAACDSLEQALSVSPN